MNWTGWLDAPKGDFCMGKPPSPVHKRHEMTSICISSSEGLDFNLSLSRLIAKSAKTKFSHTKKTLKSRPSLRPPGFLGLGMRLHIVGIDHGARSSCLVPSPSTCCIYLLHEVKGNSVLVPRLSALPRQLNKIVWLRYVASTAQQDRLSNK